MSTHEYIQNGFFFTWKLYCCNNSASYRYLRCSMCGLRQTWREKENLGNWKITLKVLKKIIVRFLHVMMKISCIFTWEIIKIKFARKSFFFFNSILFSKINVKINVIKMRKSFMYKFIIHSLILLRSLHTIQVEFLKKKGKILQFTLNNVLNVWWVNNI